MSTAEEVRDHYVDALAGHEPFEDVYLYCRCGQRIPDNGYARHILDVLTERELLPVAEEIHTCLPSEPAADDEAMVRYVTDWREVSRG